MGPSGRGMLRSPLPQIWKQDSRGLWAELLCHSHTNVFHNHAHRTQLLHQVLESLFSPLFLIIFLPFLTCHSHFMGGKYPFFSIESNFPFPEGHSLWTSFGWTLQSSLKREPFPTVLEENSLFEVTAGLTKLISSIHNVCLMQCWLMLPLARLLLLNQSQVQCLMWVFGLA